MKENLKFEFNKLIHSKIVIFIIIILLLPLIWGLILKIEPAWLVVEGKSDLFVYTLTMLQFVLLFKLHIIFFIFTYSSLGYEMSNGQLFYHLVRSPNRNLVFFTKYIFNLSVILMFISFFSLISFTSYNLFIKGSKFGISKITWWETNQREIVIQIIFLLCYLVFLITLTFFISVFIKSINSIFIVILIDIVLGLLVKIEDIKFYIPNFIALSNTIHDIEFEKLLINAIVILVSTLLILLLTVVRFNKTNL
ncbi:hypothetical protein [Staphylococcus caeli]|uniref:ABC-2 family transporter protein n=1 Tax=Staphylococcus caeli TaxID=2201815 RepID=A0A1D4NH06_9STAP|nr:hypothetical protein [Staphylococcus caeli]AWM30242.1 hypothetical protein SCC82B_00102 [Staphylococcus caeli]SCT09980.1 ABC-2 family transporter protein [Staphylococcus caeli]SCT13016.1 ABC-2 family transporter protein [Staphylococcus caeli]